MRKTFTSHILIFAALIWIPVFSLGQCITTYPYFQNFESSNGGWTASSITANGLGPVSWVWVHPTKPIINSAASGQKCWVTGNNPNLLAPLEPWSYAPNEFSAVKSPCLDFSTLLNPGIQVKVWWESEFSQDGTVLQSSIDGGVTWQRVGNLLDPVFWYNEGTIIGGVNGGPAGQQVGWTGTVQDGSGSGGWLEAQHSLSNLAGEPNVRLRFAFASDAVASNASLADGFAFDDLLIADMPYVNLGPDTVVCFADTIFLNACAPQAIEYQWNTSPVDTLCTNIAVATGQYVVTVRDTLGFVVKDTVNLTVSNTFVNFPPAALICPGDTLVLNADNPQANVTWLPGGQTTQLLEVFASGTYQVILTDFFGCFETDSIAVAVDQVPIVELGPDTTICSGESLILDAGQTNPGTTYLWTPNGAITQAVFVSAPGEYEVVVTTGAGCVTSDSITIAVALDPVVNLGPDRIACGSFTLNAGNPGSTYLWSTGATSQSLTLSTPGVYGVTVTNSTGCSSYDAVQITAGQIPSVNLGPNRVICNSVPVQLNAGPGSSFLWSNGATSQTLSTATPGQYIVLVTNADGCTDRDTVIVSLSTLNVNLGFDRFICQGDQVVLNAGAGGQTYQWSTGGTGQTITVSNAGTYSVAATDASGCVDRDTVVLSLQNPIAPAFTVLGNPVLYANLTFDDQTAGTPNGWLWSFGDGATSTQANPQHTYQSLGTFDVCLTITDDACVRTTCQKLTINIFNDAEESLFSRFDLYPNPGPGLFTLAMDLLSPETVELEITDLAGRRIWSDGLGMGDTFETQIDLRGMPAGIYVLRTRAGEKVYHSKVQIR